MRNVSDIAVSLAVLLPPCAAIVWAWWKRAVPSRTLRERLSFWGLSTLTVDVLYCGVFLLWPYFGATLGSGAHRWERTLTLVGYGFWLSALALILAAAASPGRVRKLLLLLSIVAVGFWFSMQIPIKDFLAVEQAQQAASQTR